MVGLIMLLATQHSGVKYAGCFFLATGIYPNVPQGVAWNGNNIGGSLKRVRFPSTSFYVTISAWLLSTCSAISL